MGYTTTFKGRFNLDKPLTEAHAAYLRAFNETRRMKRNAAVAETLPDPRRLAVGLPIGSDGAYFVGAEGFMGQHEDISVLDGNVPPGQGLKQQIAISGSSRQFDRPKDGFCNRSTRRRLVWSFWRLASSFDGHKVDRSAVGLQHGGDKFNAFAVAELRQLLRAAQGVLLAARTADAVAEDDAQGVQALGDAQPGLWCQWCPTDDGTGIEWDQGEKFYYYAEWLQYLVKHFLAPWGYVLNGEVTWRGEEHGDTGTLRCVANKVTASAN